MHVLNSHAQSAPDSRLARYVARFNATDSETVKNAIPNDLAAGWLRANIPLFECSDPAVEETYYFRWWVYRKHLRQTPAGYVVTEFLPPVPWAGMYNTISCPAGHHFYEGRWLRNPQYLTDYARLWFGGGGQPRLYSFWAADAIDGFLRVHPNRPLTTELLPKLVDNFLGWEKSNQDSTGLYWQLDDRDGMEKSIGGDGYRATINSYQYGDANAIARMAASLGNAKLAKQYAQKAAILKKLVQQTLWDETDHFFKVRPRSKGASLVRVRELHGYVPWYFSLPDHRYTIAWQFLKDTTCFKAPYGPTTAERCDPRFNFKDTHECLWNGPSWPFATTQTLVALANVLNGPAQPYVSAQDYWTLFQTYTRSQQRRQPDGSIVPWIDEDLDPFTGEWVARRELQAANRPDKDRGKDYNHSAYADLLITGLIGLRPSSDEKFVINPLLPPGAWTYFRIDKLPYRGHLLTIQFDQDGKHYRQGPGLMVWLDGQLMAKNQKLGRVTFKLPRPN